MWRHAKNIDIIILAKLLKFERIVALMTVKYKQLARAYPTLCCMLDKVPQPLYPKLVGSPAVVAYCEGPVARYVVLLIPGREVILASKDNKRRDHPASNADCVNSGNPPALTWLDSLWPRLSEPVITS